MIDHVFWVIKLSQGQESIDQRIILSKSLDKLAPNDLDEILSRMIEKI